MDIKKELWGKASCGKEIYRYTLTNASGAYVQLSSVGAGIVAVVVPDRDGKLADVLLGYPEPLSYFADGPCAGKVPGRYANRIALGHLEVDGKVYELPINNGPNHLHGGPKGFQNKIWDSAIEGGSVVFKRHSDDGDMGYPGAIDVCARYSWSEDNVLELTLSAVSDADTVVNLTNHAYWNLEGEGAGCVFDHEMKLNASRWLPTDKTLIPTGELAPVAGTPMDFTSAKKIGRDVKEDFDALKFGKGYDNCWAIDGYDGTLKQAAELRSAASGRVMKVFTTQPGVQVYTGNWLSGCPVAKCGRSYNDYDGVAIECQHFPDSPNKPQFPTTALKAGENFEEKIVFSFGVE